MFLYATRWEARGICTHQMGGMYRYTSTRIRKLTSISYYAFTVKCWNTSAKHSKCLYCQAWLHKRTWKVKLNIICVLGTANFTLFTPRCWNSFFHSLISLGKCRAFSADVAIHTVPIFVLPSTHYRVDRGGVDAKLSQGFYTWPTLRASNPRSPDLWSNALTTCSTCHLH